MLETDANEFCFFACVLDFSILLQVKVQAVTMRSTGSKESHQPPSKWMMSPAVELLNLPRRKELFSTFTLHYCPPPPRLLHISDMRRAVLDGGPAKYVT